MSACKMPCDFRRMLGGRPYARDQQSNAWAGRMRIQRSQPSVSAHARTARVHAHMRGHTRRCGSLRARECPFDSLRRTLAQALCAEWALREPLEPCGQIEGDSGRIGARVCPNPILCPCRTPSPHQGQLFLSRMECGMKCKNGLAMHVLSKRNGWNAAGSV